MLIELEGSPLERGLIHGQKARERIRHNLRVYFERFQSEGLSKQEVLRRAAAYQPAIQTQDPEYAEELRGISEGSGCDLMELVALNVRYEILYHQFTKKALAKASGCTSFAVLPERTKGGHLLLGENWDWIPQVQGVVLHICETDLEILCFTEAGIVGGKIGFNSRGLGLAINGLVSTDDDWSRLAVPFHVRCYEILRSHDLKEAVRIITQGERACSANFLIAQVDDQAVDIEAAPFATRKLIPEDGFLAHTNHFLDPKALGIVEPPVEKRPHSLQRLKRLHELLDSKDLLTVDEAMAYLRDHNGYPYSICRHMDEDEPPSERYKTVVSVVMDLHEQVMWISDGPPCEKEYQELRLQS